MPKAGYFGFQFTIFRRAITPLAQPSSSEFRASDIYLAHFTVSDIQNGDFYHDLRYARGGAGLAGAEVDPFYRVWLEDWAVSALGRQCEQDPYHRRQRRCTLSICTSTK